MGYVIGGLAGLALAFIAGQFLLHDFAAGLMPGLVLGLWVGLSIEHQRREQTNSMLFPAPLKCSQSLKQVYPQVKKLIREYTYQYGKTFRIHPTNPSQSRELKADMTWADTDRIAELLPGDSKGRKLAERHVRLEIYFRSPDANSTTIEIHWYPMAEGLDPSACESVIREVNEQLRQLLGADSDDQQPAKERWIPPVWLHITTIICTALYLLIAASRAFALWSEPTSNESVTWKQKLKDLDTEIGQWQQFKQHKQPEVFLQPQAPTNESSGR